MPIRQQDQPGNAEHGAEECKDKPIAHFICKDSGNESQDTGHDIYGGCQRLCCCVAMAQMSDDARNESG